MIPLARPWFDGNEAEAAKKVVASEWLISGPIVEKFEKEFSKKMRVKYAVAVNSGSSALLVIQQALGISAGDEVVVPNMTFISTATSCMYLGAKPVFADINLKTYCVDPDSARKKITKKTKAIIPVHYAGQSCDMDALIAIAKKYKLFLIEDAAEAHLAEYKGRRVGGIGHAGIFSFTPSKPMTTGEGGMITTNDRELARKCLLLRSFHDTGKFQWEGLGFNFRMPEVKGAIGLVQLGKLDKAISIRRAIAKKYTKGLSKLEAVTPPYERGPRDINYQLYTIRLALDKLSISRDEFIDELHKRGIQSRLYYPCLHKQKVFAKFPAIAESDLKNSLAYEQSALSLPIFPGLKNGEVDHVISSIKDIVNKTGISRAK